MPTIAQILFWTHEISTVGVELTTEVIGGQVELGLVEEGDNLEVRGRTKELESGDSASGNETGTFAGLRAPGDFLALRLADGGGAGGGSPDTPVWRHVRPEMKSTR